MINVGVLTRESEVPAEPSLLRQLMVGRTQLFGFQTWLGAD